jgi:hypothetical protein
MNLLASDSMLLDPTFDETARWTTSLIEYVLSAEPRYDGYEDDAPEAGR